MTIDLGGPGISGFGYGSQGNSGQSDQPAIADNDRARQAQAEPAASPQPAGSGAGQSQSADDSLDGNAEVVTRDLGYDQVPGFETSASNCVNRARQIAQSLSHATFSSDHLMLALTMEPSARRLLERVGDVNQLRAVAMRKLGKNYNKSDSGNQAPTPTADLADIGKRALQAAAEREQSVSISDLIDAFHHEGGRLTYGAGDGSRALAVMETIEKQVIPGVNDAVTRIENAIVDAVQRQHQSVQSLLSDLSSRQSQEWERRQREFMDEVRRQVREAADTQFAAALKELNEKFQDRVGELQTEQESPSVVTPAVPGAGTAPSSASTATEGAAPEKKGGSWNWLSML
jgi:hypothetical protein